MARLDRIGTPLRFHDRGAAEQPGDAGAVEGRRHGENPQVFPQRALRVEGEGETKVGIEERSWNSSNSTAPMPVSSGSSRIMRVNTPSVTTSIRVRAEILEPSRTRRPTMSPTRSPRVEAMRSAAPRAASRRGSRRMIFCLPSQGSSRRASGTRVVLPAPGGATSTAEARSDKAARRAGRAASIGSAGDDMMREVARFARRRNHPGPVMTSAEPPTKIC
ncbi:hypothetical protein GCM10025880_19040 [Methylorubrum aminovorans]|nr:hypothetical protein GCM10025880_19040 [Methylorubrum aminovorans]